MMHSIFVHKWVVLLLILFNATQSTTYLRPLLRNYENYKRTKRLNTNNQFYHPTLDTLRNDWESPMGYLRQPGYLPRQAAAAADRYVNRRNLVRRMQEDYTSNADASDMQALKFDDLLPFCNSKTSEKTTCKPPTTTSKPTCATPKTTPCPTTAKSCDTKPSSSTNDGCEDYDEGECEENEASTKAAPCGTTPSPCGTTPSPCGATPSPCGATKATVKPSCPLVGAPPAVKLIYIEPMTAEKPKLSPLKYAFAPSHSPDELRVLYPGVQPQQASQNEKYAQQTQTMSQEFTHHIPQNEMESEAEATYHLANSQSDDAFTIAQEVARDTVREFLRNNYRKSGVKAYSTDGLPGEERRRQCRRVRSQPPMSPRTTPLGYSQFSDYSLPSQQTNYPLHPQPPAYPLRPQPPGGNQVHTQPSTNSQPQPSGLSHPQPPTAYPYLPIWVPNTKTKEKVQNSNKPKNESEFDSDNFGGYARKQKVFSFPWSSGSSKSSNSFDTQLKADAKKSFSDLDDANYYDNYDYNNIDHNVDTNADIAMDAVFLDKDKSDSIDDFAVYGSRKLRGPLDELETTSLFGFHGKSGASTDAKTTKMKPSKNQKNSNTFKTDNFNLNFNSNANAKAKTSNGKPFAMKSKAKGKIQAAVTERMPWNNPNFLIPSKYDVQENTQTDAKTDDSFDNSYSMPWQSNVSINWDTFKLSDALKPLDAVKGVWSSISAEMPVKNLKDNVDANNFDENVGAPSNPDYQSKWLYNNNAETQRRVENYPSDAILNLYRYKNMNKNLEDLFHIDKDRRYPAGHTVTNRNTHRNPYRNSLIDEASDDLVPYCKQLVDMAVQKATNDACPCVPKDRRRSPTTNSETTGRFCYCKGVRNNGKNTPDS